MSTANPTALRIGMTGNLLGTNYTIRGRVVLSMDEAGETWYWNEFFLKAANNEEATLVYEETERGPVWRLFHYFEPSAPLSIVDASRVREGGQVQVDEYRGTVDAVAQSNVRFIEGEAPEGVERGDLSSYFNVNADGKILVVSWAAGEVEHYLGQTITRSHVQEAFGASSQSQGLPRPSGGYTRYLSAGSNESSGGLFSAGRLVMYAIFGFILLVVVATAVPSCYRSGGFHARPAPEVNYTAGKVISFQGHDYRVRSAAIIEYATAAATRLARAYLVVDADGATCLLLYGTLMNPTEGLLLQRSMVTEVPQSLAALKQGQVLTREGIGYSVYELFRIKLLRRDYGSTEDLSSFTLRYGFLARAGTVTRMFDWDERTVCATTVVNVPSAKK